MDYEKKYKEVLERAKELLEIGVKDTRDKRVVLSFFPELAEGEDERMVRVIMNALTKSPYSELDGLIPDTIRIWLERKIKQGEQKPILDVEIPFGAKDSELKEVTYDIPKGYHAEIDGNKVVIKKGEQKSAEWSEEDERDFDTVYGIIYNSCNAEDASRLIAWLKAIKDRIVPQPQQQWKPSDEQMDALENAIRYGEEESIGILSLLYNDLKKLREG